MRGFLNVSSDLCWNTYQGNQLGILFFPLNFPLTCLFLVILTVMVYYRENTEIKINQSNFPQIQRPHIYNASLTDKITWFTSIHNHWSWHLIYAPARRGGVSTTSPGINWEESQGIKQLQSFCSWQGWTRQNPWQHPPRMALLPTSFNNYHCS